MMSHHIHVTISVQWVRGGWEANTLPSVLGAELIKCFEHEYFDGAKIENK